MVRGLSHLSHIDDPQHRPRTCAGASAALRRRARTTRDAFAAILLCATLAGCAGGIRSIYSTDPWVEPGKYEFIKCPDIAKRSVGLSQQEKTVMSLMERANQDAAGPLVNLMVYQAQLQQVRANIELLQQTSREKGCNSIVPAAPK